MKINSGVFEKRLHTFFGVLCVLAGLVAVGVVDAETSTYGSALNLTGVNDLFNKIWGPGSNGIVLGGGLNFSTHVGVGSAQQYSGIYVTSYSIQDASSPYLTQASTTANISITGPSGSIVEVFDLESMVVVATNRTSPGTQTTFSAQPYRRYGGFGWYADNSQKDIELHAVLVSSSSPTRTSSETSFSTSNTDTTTTPASAAPVEIPVSPMNFAMVHRDGSKIGFSWADNSSNEEYFELFVQRPLVGNKRVATISANNTVVTYTAEPGMNYFSIRACNDVGCSAVSNTVVVDVVSSTTTVTTTPPPTNTISTTTSVVVESQTIEQQKLLTQESQQGNLFILGTITDTNSVPLKISGFVEIFHDDIALGRAGGLSFTDGKFAVNVHPGTYYVRVYLPRKSGYSSSQAQKITVTNTTTVQFVATADISTITGKVLEGASVANGVTGRIMATNKDGVWQNATILQDGSYTLNIGAGRWLVGIEIKDKSGFVATEDDLFIVDVPPGIMRAERNFTVRKAATVVDGYVLDQDGVGVADVYVAFGVGEYSPSLTSTSTNSLDVIRNTTTDQKGYFSVLLPPGRYYAKTFVRADRGYINAQERLIDVASSRLTVNLTLQRPDVMITGFVYSSGVPVSNAFVWAWSKKGGYQETVSNNQGAYSLRVVPNSSWVIVAAAHVNGTEYRADEIAVDIAAASAKHDVELHTNRMVPKAAILETSATAPLVLTVASGGPTLVAPANTFSSSGSVEIAVVPDTRAPSQGRSKVVGMAYDFSASNASGQKITKFADEVVITIPYTDIDVTALGVNENSLMLSFWDEGVSAWKNVENSIVNVAANTVTASVNHFTRYAVLAPADVIPPEPPIVMLASAIGAGKIKVVWTNPAKDFDHAKIYRSSSKGTLGSIIVSEVSGAEYTDGAGLLNNLAYYYTVRAVDPAGNESNNMTQTSVVAIGSSTVAPVTPISSPLVKGVTGNLTRTLKVGSRGADVSTLQKLLVQENVYPEEIISGYFGNLTKAAVIRFQEKYRAEILTPVGLFSGTGLVGVSTRAKINTLIKG